MTKIKNPQYLDGFKAGLMEGDRQWLEAETKGNEKFYDKLIDLIEEEIVLSSGVKSKEHHSGKCRMNDILSLVAKQLKN